jgi:hypothetical protein
MKISGFARNNFVLRDSGTQITGYNVYLSTPVNPALGEGEQVDRIYLSDAKLAACGVDIKEAYGKDVTVYYNRYGKVASLVVNE